MDYFFKSEGCPGCFMLFKILEEKAEKWTGYLKIVDVEFDKETKKLMTYIDGEEAGQAPIGVVPAYYSARDDKLVTGNDAVWEIIQDASWNNKS